MVGSFAAHHTPFRRNNSTTALEDALALFHDEGMVIFRWHRLVPTTEGQSALMDSLDELWADLLSGEAQRIQRAWAGLSAEEQRAVFAHLSLMRDGTGWHPAQREAAAAALALVQPPSEPLT